MKPIFNRQPLTENFMSQLPLGAIRPQGWLKAQLQTQADGLSGRLYEVWPDVNRECAWLGGDGDAWERAPYYLDGLVPLAWELGDEKFKDVCLTYIEKILASQREDGWFGPEQNSDMWPRMVVLKVLQQYFTATGDKRVIYFMDKYFRYQYKNLSTHPLEGWGCARGGDNMLMALWLYNITEQKYLIELCKKLKEQTLDWANIFDTFPFTQPMSKSIPVKRLSEGMAEDGAGLLGSNHPYFWKQYHSSHVVNVAMGLKTPGVVSLFKSGSKELRGFKSGWEKLMRHHGVANGMFTGDEHLNGQSPVQGTETCAVVEAMYSLEQLNVLGDFGAEIPDILEKIAFNALPAAFDKDMQGHQYDQQVNQVKVSKEIRPWYNNNEESNLFAFDPNFGCCTANYHQGWPKFVAALWNATKDDGLSAVSYAPCTVRARVSDVPVKLTVSGNYPFGDTVTIEVQVKQPVEFPLYLRIPRWAKQPLVFLPNGEMMQVCAGKATCINQKWIGGEKVQLSLPMEARITRWYHQSAAVELGPLLMAFRPEETFVKTGEKYGVDELEVMTTEDWNYALIPNEPMKVVYDPEAGENAFKKGNPPVCVYVKAVKVPWGMDGANAAGVPIAPMVSAENSVTLKLVPYGTTSLRIGQFPVAVVSK